MKILKLRHVIRSQQFKAAILERLFESADAMRERFQNPDGKLALTQILQGREMLVVMYQPSTRTRISFELAGERLGMRVHATESAGQFSSAAKGENVLHTCRVLAGYEPDVIILRHPVEGSLSEVSRTLDQCGYGTGVINAGDGMGQHPTQALLDLYTLNQAVGRLDNITVIVGADLARSRTTHSFVYLLGRYPDNKFIFVSPDNLRMKKGVLGYLKRHGASLEETNRLKEKHLRQADAIYWVRSQQEYGEGKTEKEKPKLRPTDSAFKITRKTLDKTPRHCVLLHPMPIVDEVAPDVDYHPKAWYFRQAANGVWIRMALLKLLLKR